MCHFGRSDSLRQLLYKTVPDISNPAYPSQDEMRRADFSRYIRGRVCPRHALPNPDISTIIRIIRNIVKELLRP